MLLMNAWKKHRVCVPPAKKWGRCGAVLLDAVYYSAGEVCERAQSFYYMVHNQFIVIQSVMIRVDTEQRKNSESYLTLIYQKALHILVTPMVTNHFLLWKSATIQSVHVCMQSTKAR